MVYNAFESRRYSFFSGKHSKQSKESEESDDKSITKARLALLLASLSLLDSVLSDASYDLPSTSRYWPDHIV